LIELRERLHSSGKTLSVSVGARTSVTDPNWNVFDYQSLGLVADKIKIMAYDLHNSKSNPGPVSSKAWINNILNYALSVVSPEKITVGLPSYAYLYSSDDKVKVITGNSFESFLLKHPGLSVRDTDSELMHHSFSSAGVNYDFYYPDAQFFKSVSSLLKERNITSVAIWSVGNEAKDIWDSLK
jgi:spore germination protein YaaH